VAAAARRRSARLEPLDEIRPTCHRGDGGRSRHEPAPSDLAPLLAAGEPPTVRGFPPSFFATVPKLIERMGTSDRGSITGLVTVLLDGDDPNEPVADTLRGLLDGHVLLSRDIAQRGRFPAIDPLASLSRLMDELVDESHLADARALRRLLAAWREGRDLVEIGAYRAGSNPELDRAIRLMPTVEAFLSQHQRETSPLDETRALLGALVRA
jgi:flagellar biosynthesis/type III secretory pathway ATPase